MKKILLILGFILVGLCGFSQFHFDPTDSTFVDKYDKLMCSKFDGEGNLSPDDISIVNYCAFTVYSNVLIKGEVGTVFYNNQTNHATGYVIYSEKWHHYSNGVDTWLSCISTYYGINKNGSGTKGQETRISIDSEAALVMFLDRSFLVYSKQ